MSSCRYWPILNNIHFLVHLRKIYTSIVSVSLESNHTWSHSHLLNLIKFKGELCLAILSRNSFDIVTFSSHHRNCMKGGRETWIEDNVTTDDCSSIHTICRHLVLSCIEQPSSLGVGRAGLINKCDCINWWYYLQTNTFLVVESWVANNSHLFQ